MKKALIVGIDKYPDGASLTGAVNDAEAIAALLATNEDQAANFSVRLERNTQRKYALMSMLSDLFSGRDNIALFYYSGHGFINEIGGYLLMPDHRRYDEGVSMTDILTMANASAGNNNKVIIILDCCYSGTIAVPNMTHGSNGHINEGITIMTASRDNQLAIETKGNGVFTSLLLEQMNGGAANINGDITPGSVYAYIDRSLGAWDQRPVFKANVSSFISLRSVKPQISTAELKKITEFFATADIPFPLDPSYEYTNDPEEAHNYKEPFAQEKNVAVFKTLQRMQSAGLVAPVGEAHMYWAAMNNKACQLTPLGAHYWQLVKGGKI
jgi:hypothetical protein